MDDTSRRAIPVRKAPLADQGQEPDLKSKSPAELIEMMWPLALEAWRFAGNQGEPEFSRHLVRVVRRRS